MRYRDCEVILYSLADMDKKPPFPHVKIRELTELMQTLVGKFVFDFIDERDKRGRKDTDEWCYWMALQELGIDCPHPVPMRGTLPYNHAEGFECKACGDWVIRALEGIEKGASE